MGKEVDDSMKKLICGILIGLILSLAFTVYAVPAEIIDTARGEVIKLFNKNGEVNVKIGAESGEGTNAGGTIVLYNHTNKEAESFDRVAIGVLRKDDSGTIQLMNTNGIINTWLTTKEGYIGNSRIATEQWLKNKGYVRKEDVQKMIEDAIKRLNLEEASN